MECFSEGVALRKVLQLIDVVKNLTFRVDVFIYYFLDFLEREFLWQYLMQSENLAYSM